MAIQKQSKPKVEISIPKLPKIDARKKIGGVVEKVNNFIYVHLIQKFKGLIIHAWIDDFEDQYLKTFKEIIVNTNEPKEVINTVTKRMRDYDYTEKIIIIVKYEPTLNFSILATQTGTEKEYSEFVKWKKLRNGGKK